jgi:hypothetical protein
MIASSQFRQGNSIRSCTRSQFLSAPQPTEAHRLAERRPNNNAQNTDYMARGRHGSRQASSALSSRAGVEQDSPHPISQVRHAGSSGNASILCREKMRCPRRKRRPRREHMRLRLPTQEADMRITPRPHVIQTPGGEFETLRHRSIEGNNMPKDVGEVETQVQRLGQGRHPRAERWDGAGSFVGSPNERTSAQRENGPSHGPSNSPAGHCGQPADPPENAPAG